MLTGNPVIQTTARRTWYRHVFVLYLLMPALVLAAPARGETVEKAAAETEALKHEAVDLISRLHQLEKKLLYPAHTRVSVFFSVAENSPVDPHSVRIEIDNNKVTDHIYTQREVNALRSGGIQRLHTGNMLTGEHRLQVSFTQRQKDGSVSTHELEHKFTKDENTEYIEIIVDNNKPHVMIKSRN